MPATVTDWIAQLGERLALLRAELHDLGELDAVDVQSVERALDTAERRLLAVLRSQR